MSDLSEPEGDFSTAFAADFKASEAAWKAAAEAALKGKPLDPLVNGRLIDGVRFDAIAPRVEARPIAGRPAGARWTAMTRIDLGDPKAANAQALEDLENGASGLSLVFAAPGDRSGLVADTLDRLDAALDGVMLDLAPIHLEIAPFQGRTTAALVAALIAKRGQKPEEVSVLFGLDLMRDLSRTGMLSLPWDKMGRRSTVTVKSLVDRGFKAPVLMLDQRPVHAAGASEAQELAGALASAALHIRLMSDNGLDVETVADTISFAFAADANQFATIAKLRAARLVWAAMRREYGLPEKPVHILAQTARRMMTRNDAQTNIVRSTIAAFAAGVGGADSIVVLPHTTAFGGADADARRIARNTQSIVLEESNAYRVADPAAGAGAIERLTNALAESAWDIFREIEGAGGLYEAMTSGAWQTRIAATRETRAKAIANRKIAIVGVSQFPKADETPIRLAEETSRPEHAPRGVELPPLTEDTPEEFDALVEGFLKGASFADADAAWKASPTRSAKPLDLARLAGPFEELRAANEKRSPRPAVFLALVGPIARHAGRAGFMRNLLEAGGIVIVDGPIESDAAAVADAFKSSGAAIAVVTGADADYAEAGAAHAKALGEAGATVWLAGKPKEGQDALQAAGVSRFVAAGDDALDSLAAASKAKGAAS